jgi:hypothetical protein
LNLDLEAIVIDITKRHVALLAEGLRSIIEETIIRRDLWDAEDVKYDDGGEHEIFHIQGPFSANNHAFDRQRPGLAFS